MLTMTEDQQNQLQTPGLEEVKEKTARLKGKESFSFYRTETFPLLSRLVQTFADMSLR